jgi:hypothetical protein
VTNGFISQVNTLTMHNKSIIHSSIACSTYLKPYNPVGFEPGSSVARAEWLTSLQRKIFHFFYFKTAQVLILVAYNVTIYPVPISRRHFFTPE